MQFVAIHLITLANQQAFKASDRNAFFLPRIIHSRVETQTLWHHFDKSQLLQLWINICVFLGWLAARASVSQEIQTDSKAAGAAGAASQTDWWYFFSPKKTPQSGSPSPPPLQFLN